MTLQASFNVGRWVAVGENQVENGIDGMSQNSVLSIIEVKSTYFAHFDTFSNIAVNG